MMAHKSALIEGSVASADLLQRAMRSRHLLKTPTLMIGRASISCRAGEARKSMGDPRTGGRSCLELGCKNRSRRALGRDHTDPHDPYCYNNMEQNFLC